MEIKRWTDTVGDGNSRDRFGKRVCRYPDIIDMILDLNE